MPNPSVSIIPYLSDYISHGWKIFPVARAAKKPLTPHGFKDASNKLEQVHDWWEKWKDANVAIVTGRDNGFWVLDIDKKSGGLETLKDLQDQHGRLNTLMIQTGGGGLHYYFKYDLDSSQRVKNGVEFLKGIDTRGDGGYVVAPPSLHSNGNHYQVIHDVDPEPAPQWLIDLLKEKNIIQSEEKKTNNGPAKHTDKTSPYGKKALEIQCQNIRTATEGTRNHTLNKAAYSIGRLIAGGEIEMTEAVMELEKAGTDAGLDAHETKNTINSGIKSGERDPKTAPAQKAKLNLFSNHYHFTDMGNSYRFKDFADKNIKYCYAWNTWLIWDGTRWQLDETGEIMTKAKEMINEMYKQAAAISSEKEETRKAALKHTMHTANSNKIQAFIHLTKNEVPVRHEDLDGNPYLLNIKTGTVDLSKDGELREPTRDDLLTKRIEYGTMAGEPTEWIKFLNDIFMGDQNLIRFIQKAIGYSLTADISEQCMFILYGTGRNGKSTFLNVISEILGDYACNTPAETLMIKKHEGIPNDIARLKGMRLVTSYETEDNKRLAEAKIKALTGGDIITARFMRGEYFEFKPTFKIWLATNHKPRIKGTDEGIWRRIKLIPFNYCIPKEKMDKHLQDKLMDEAEMILRWAIKGTGLWQSEGLGEPEAVTQATTEYRDESDTIGIFLRETIEEDTTSTVTKKALYAHYSKWCEENGEYKISQKFFSLAVQERGIAFYPKRIKQERCWANIRFKEDVEEYVEERI